MITKQNLKSAELFTVFKGGQGVADVPAFNNNLWDIFAIDNGDTCDDQVIDYMSLEDINLMSDYEMFLEPQICLEAAGIAGISHEIDDMDAALLALNAGFDLVKAPDNMYERYFRFYIKDSEGSRIAAQKYLERM